MPSSGVNGQLVGQANKKNILMAYNSKSGTKPSKAGDRYQELGKIYNQDYNSNSNQKGNLQNLQTINASNNINIQSQQSQSQIFNTIGHSNYASSASNKKNLIHQQNQRMQQHKDSTKRSGTTGGTSNHQGIGSGFGNTPSGQLINNGNGAGAITLQNQNVYNSINAVGGGALDQQHNNGSNRNPNMNKRNNRGTSESVQKHISMQKIEKMRSQAQTQLGMHQQNMYGQLNDPALNNSMVYQGQKNAGSRRRQGGQSVGNPPNNNAGQVDPLAQHGASSGNSKVSLKQNLVTSSQHMPELVKKKTSGRSGGSKMSSQVAQSVNLGAIMNGRGSIKKDNQLQTITLIPNTNNANSKNGLNLNQQQQQNLQSLDYSSGGAMTRADLQLKESNTSISREGNTSGSRQARGASNRNNRTISHQSNQNSNQNNYANDADGGDGDIVNFSGQDIDDDHIFQHQGDSNDELVSLPPPSQYFHGKKIARVQKGMHHQGGAVTQSIDRSSQHMLIVQNLAKELEIQLEQQMKDFNIREEEHQKVWAAQVKAKQEEAAAQKKSGAKPTYEEQKKTETDGLKGQQKQIEHSHESNAKKLEIFASVLTQITQKDKTYMNVLSQIADSLKSMATTEKDKVAKEQTSLLTALHTQSQEFHRRYNNVKQRNESSDKVIQEMKKQLTCYKEEIENMKKMEAHLTVENYQKLVNDFNQLYDHYKMHKQMAKKLKVELGQSNHRERTFLKLLKKTEEFGEQAGQLEQEYDKLYANGDDTLNLSNEQKFIEVSNKIQIPMLDLSIIKIQQQEGNGDTSTSNDQSGQYEENEDELGQPVEQDINEVDADIHDIAQNDISVIEHSELTNGDDLNGSDVDGDHLIFPQQKSSNMNKEVVVQKVPDSKAPE